VSETKTTAPQKTGQQPARGQNLITELKVSGHLMTFDAGLFCIFTPPGSPVSDPQTGLPGIRISLPPGPAFRPDAITISTFRDDGWLGGWNGAALVRVARGPAQLLVTIYQAPNAKGDAPKLQIMRLTEGSPVPAGTVPPNQAAPPAPPAALEQQTGAIAAPPAAKQAAPALPQNTPPGGAATAQGAAEIVAHIQTRGDVTARLTDWMGVQGSKHWVEGFAITPKQMIGPNDIEYQAVLGRGWLSPWSEGGQFCGSRGMSLPILGLRVRLRGEAAERYDCALTASFVDGTKIGPLDNGEPCQAESLAPLEAFHVSLTPRSGDALTPRSGDSAASSAPAKATAKAPPKAATKPAAKTPPKPAPVAKPPAKPVKRK
jgi:hypothetical protein